MSHMTHRERVMRALNRQEPDRVPIDFGSTVASTIVREAYENMKRFLGVESETRFMDKTSSRVWPDEAILERFEVDTRMLMARPPVTAATHAAGSEYPDSYRDRWGVVWRVTDDGRYYVEKPPFAGEPGLADLDVHRWPDPDDLTFATTFAARARELRQRTDCAIVLELPGKVFSLGHYLCGFEDWLIHLVSNPKFAGALLDRAVGIESQMVKNILDAVGDDVDVVLCADDLGWQDAPLISPELYRQAIWPHHRRLFETIKRHTQAKLLLHSDGAIAPLIGDLIDAGIDALNPVQVSAQGMGDSRRLKREYGRHLTFWGAIDTHRVLPFGTPAEVREEVRKRIEDLAPGGGYVLASVHNLQAEVPPENICAMFEAARDYGRYG